MNLRGCLESLIFTSPGDFLQKTARKPITFAWSDKPTVGVNPSFPDLPAL
jgi:hypothetical protein